MKIQIRAALRCRTAIIFKWHHQTPDGSNSLERLFWTPKNTEPGPFSILFSAQVKDCCFFFFFSCHNLLRSFVRAGNLTNSADVCAQSDKCTCKHAKINNHDFSWVRSVTAGVTLNQTKQHQAVMFTVSLFCFSLKVLSLFVVLLLDLSWTWPEIGPEMLLSFDLSKNKKQSELQFWLRWNVTAFTIYYHFHFGIFANGTLHTYYNVFCFPDKMNIQFFSSNLEFECSLSLNSSQRHTQHTSGYLNEMRKWTSFKQY